MSISINVNSANSNVTGDQSIDSQIKSLQSQIKRVEDSAKTISEQLAKASATDPNKAVLQKLLDNLERQIEMLNQRMLQLQQNKARQNKTGSANPTVNPAVADHPLNTSTTNANGQIDVVV